MASRMLIWRRFVLEGDLGGADSTWVVVSMSLVAVKGSGISAHMRMPQRAREYAQMHVSILTRTHAHRIV